MDTKITNLRVSPQGVRGEMPGLAAACYPLGAMSAGLVPFFISLWAWQRGKAHLAFQSKQAMLWNVLVMLIGYCGFWFAGLGALFVYLATGFGGRSIAYAIWRVLGFLYAGNFVIMFWPMASILIRKQFSFPILTNLLLARHRDVGDCEAMLRGTVDFVWYILGAITLGIGPILLEGLAKSSGIAISTHMVRARNRNLFLLAFMVLALGLGIGGIMVLLLVGLVNGDQVAMLIPWVGLGVISVIVANLLIGLLAGWAADAGE